MKEGKRGRALMESRRQGWKKLSTKEFKRKERIEEEGYDKCKGKLKVGGGSKGRPG